MADKRISQLIERVDIANNDVLPIVASGATTTNKVTISTIQNWMQDNLDVGVTSVGITLGSSGTDVNVTGSPITTSGNITINIPTASATNRGLLSAADWSTFNGKQNSITLTTSGTSGAATLVGSTLNIPNYSTGVANAYVPYVGAIGSVTLGYNSLSASQINIDGASPTGGSYLGFKHSTSVNTGTDGYTSMYTFGTNTIAFKSVSGGNSKDFSFSMVGITPNVAGGRQYTLPDASGTLALTSDLSGYVTLGTAQTITGSKTFNSRIIGQDATLTSSGSTNTLEVFHTSGSGHAVEIQKAGNGEGLRVIKTSGSGNAVTISGGLLSAEAVTLTGALNGTSASFTGVSPRVSAQGNTSTGFPGFQLSNTTQGYEIIVRGNASNALQIRNSTASTDLLSIDSTGGATFSSSVQAGGMLISTGGVTMAGSWVRNMLLQSAYPVQVFESNAGGTSRFAGFAYDRTGGMGVYVNATNIDFASSVTPSLFIANSGAATFSSSVTVQGSSLVVNGSGSNVAEIKTNSDANALVLVSSANLQDSKTRIELVGTTNSTAPDQIFYRANTHTFTGSNASLGARVTINSSGNVGIGTTSPSNPPGFTRVLNISGEDAALVISNTSGTAKNYTIGALNNGSLGIFDGTTGRIRITSDGNVGIGTGSPQDYSGFTTLHINGKSGGNGGVLRLTAFDNTSSINIYTQSGSAIFNNTVANSSTKFLSNDVEKIAVTSNGLTFNGDTAAANALDDYEEGTWTPTSVSGGLPFSIQAARYTKVGRIVTIQAYIEMSSSGNSSSVRIGGAPFNSASQGWSVGSLDVSYCAKIGGYARIEGGGTEIQLLVSSGSTSLERLEIKGNEFGAPSYMIFTITYQTS